MDFIVLENHVFKKIRVTGSYLEPALEIDFHKNHGSYLKMSVVILVANYPPTSFCAIVVLVSTAETLLVSLHMMDLASVASFWLVVPHSLGIM